MATEAITSGQTSVQAELRRTAHTRESGVEQPVQTVLQPVHTVLQPV